MRQRSQQYVHEHIEGFVVDIAIFCLFKNWITLLKITLHNWNHVSFLGAGQAIGE